MATRVLAHFCNATYSIRTRRSAARLQRVRRMGNARSSVSTASSAAHNTARREAPAESVEAPLFTFGIAADVQYAGTGPQIRHIDDGKSFGGTPRYYRNSLLVLREAVDHWQRNSVDFAVHLGDIVDGLNPSGTGERALTSVLREFDVLGKRHYHMLGNHCLYNLPRPVLNRRLRIPEADSGASYYSFVPHRGFRFVVLDCYDISVLGWPVGHPNREAACALLARKNGNANLNSPEGLKGSDRRFVAFGGGCSDEQLGWLRGELGAAQAAGERVVVLGHLPLHPASSPAVCLLWNYEEVLAILSEHPCVCATLAGHTHSDGYSVDSAGIHHRVLAAVLECPPGERAYATVNVFENRMEICGVGRLGSASLSWVQRMQPSNL